MPALSSSEQGFVDMLTLLLPLSKHITILVIAAGVIMDGHGIGATQYWVRLTMNGHRVSDLPGKRRASGLQSSAVMLGKRDCYHVESRVHWTLLWVEQPAESMACAPTQPNFPAFLCNCS